MDLVLRVTYYLNLKEPPSESQMSVIADFLKSEFPNLTTVDIGTAFKKAASGQLKVDPGFNQMSIFYWGKILSAYTEYLNEQRLHQPIPDEVIDEAVSEETRAKIEEMKAGLLRKATDWRNDKTLRSSQQDAYTMAQDAFAMQYAEKFGGYAKARQAWAKAIPLDKWRDSKDLSWVEVEISKLVL